MQRWLGCHVAAIGVVPQPLEGRYTLDFPSGRDDGMFALETERRDNSLFKPS